MTIFVPKGIFLATQYSSTCVECCVPYRHSIAVHVWSVVYLIEIVDMITWVHMDESSVIQRS